jgi:EmrB/QacA subfamily drug resistance transporter
MPYRDPSSAGAAHATGRPANSPGAGRWVLAASIIGSGMAFIDGSVVSIALPILQKDFGIPVSTSQWVVEAYALFLSSLVLVGGALADRFGRRRLFVLGTFVFAAASLACGLAPSAAALIASRAVQGVGAALLVPASLAMLGAAFPEKERGRAVGTWSAGTAIATAIGPALGGWLVQTISWRAVFIVNLPLAAVVVWIAQRRVPESRNPDSGPLDLAGAVLATAGLGLLVFGLIEAPTVGWASPGVWVPIAAGAIGLAAFVAVEVRRAHPMVPIGFFRKTAFTAANLLTFCLYAALAALFFFLPFVLIQARGYSPAGAGISVLPLVVIVSAGSRYAGSVADRIGPRLPLTVGPAVTAAGFFLFAVLPGKGSYALTVLPALAVVGVGLAITIAPLTTTVLNSVEQADQGAASGINNAVARVAGLLAVAVLGIAATGAFNRGVDRRLDAAHVSQTTRELFAPERSRFGAARAPSAATPAEKQAIHEGVADGLEDAFRRIGLLGAALSLLAAACGGLGIRHATTARPERKKRKTSRLRGAKA